MKKSYWNLVTAPTDFFKSVKTEKKHTTWLFFALLWLISSALLVAGIRYTHPAPEQFGPGYWGGWYILLAVCIVFAFVAAATMHAICWLFGARGGYKETFKILAYGSWPVIAMMWPLFPLMNRMSDNIGITYALMFVAFGYIPVFWSLGLYYKGIRALHKLQGVRAFFCASIGWITALGTFVACYLLFLFLYMSVGLAIAFASGP